MPVVTSLLDRERTRADPRRGRRRSRLRPGGDLRVLQDSGFDVVGTASDARELVRMAEAYRPDVIIADIQMPPDHSDDGLRAALAIRAAQPGSGSAGAVPVPGGQPTLSTWSPTAPRRGLPAQGKGRRSAGVRRRGAARGRRRVGARPGRGGAAGGPQAEGQPARQPDSPGARGARPHRRGPVQRGHRAASSWSRWPRSNGTSPASSTSSGSGRLRTRTAGSWPCCSTCRHKSVGLALGRCWESLSTSLKDAQLAGQRASDRLVAWQQTRRTPACMDAGPSAGCWSN